MEFLNGIEVWDIENELLMGFKKNTSLAAQGALAHRRQRRTACNTSPPA